VQRVEVQGSQGGDGADDASEYNTALLAQSVKRANTWVWGTGHTAREGIGTASEGVLITLGNGVSTSTVESQVAVGLEYSIPITFEVYALTHPDLRVDYRFKPDDHWYALGVDVSTDAATGNRMALAYNGQEGTGTAYPRPMFSARYTDDKTIRLERRKTHQAFPAWVQGIDFSGLVALSTQTGDPAALLGNNYTLGAGQTMSVTFEALLDTPWTNGPIITNTASVVATGVPAPATSVVINSITTTPAITVAKNGPETALVDDTVVYNFSVNNIGDSLLEDVQVEDDYAGTATRISGDTDGDNKLDTTETWIYAASYTIQPTDPTPLVNTVTVNGIDSLGILVSANDTHSTTWSDIQPRLRIDEDWPTSVNVDETIAYTFTVSHDAPSDGSPVSNVAVSDTLVGSLTRASGDDGDDLLEQGESWVYPASYTVLDTDPNPLTNTVTVTGQDQASRPVIHTANYETEVISKIRTFLPLILRNR
jgi:hypothetical protein